MGALCGFLIHAPSMADTEDIEIFPLFGWTEKRSLAYAEGASLSMRISCELRRIEIGCRNRLRCFQFFVETSTGEHRNTAIS